MAKKQVTIFLFFFAASEISNYRHYSISTPPQTLPDMTLVLGVLVFAYLLLNGHSRRALIAACAAGLIMALADSSISNHECLYLGLVATMLATYAFSMIRERSPRVDLSAYHETLSRLFRIEFCVFYFWVAFHKLNPQFFDNDVSCAIHQLAKTSILLPALPISGWLVAWSPYFTWSIEAAIPILLVIPRTRRFGVLLAIVFHTTLSIRYPAFQFLVMGYLALFIPEQAWRRVSANIAVRLNALVPWGLPILRKPWVRIALGIVVVIVSGEFWHLDQFPAHARIFDILIYRITVFMIFGATLIFYLVRIMRDEAWRSCGPLPLLPRAFAVLYLLPIAIFLQGLQPHLGFKSVQSFAMFSNLDTEDGQSNHYLIPASWQISSNLSDSVLVHNSSHPLIVELISRHENENHVLIIPPRIRMLARHWQDPTAPDIPAPPPPVFRTPYLEIRRIVTRLSRAGVSGLWIDYSRDGERRFVKNAERKPKLTNASLIERIYLRTRPIATSSHGSCRW